MVKPARVPKLFDKYVNNFLLCKGKVCSIYQFKKCTKYSAAEYKQNLETN